MAERQKLVKPFSIRGPLPEGLAIAQEMKFSINVLKSTSDQIRSFLSANQIVKCFKLKKLKKDMRYQVGFLLQLKLEEILCYFGL